MNFENEMQHTIIYPTRERKYSFPYLILCIYITWKNHSAHMNKAYIHRWKCSAKRAPNVPPKFISTL